MARRNARRNETTAGASGRGRQPSSFTAFKFLVESVALWDACGIVQQSICLGALRNLRKACPGLQGAEQVLESPRVATHNSESLRQQALPHLQDFERRTN